MTETPTRLRLRRRLLTYSAPLAVVALLVAVKLMSVAVAGNSALDAFTRGDGRTLRTDAAILGTVNLVQPANAPFAAGVAAVLDGRLEDAEAHFVEALALTDAAASCPALVNLELIRETQGDRAAAAGDTAGADERYVSALAIVADAPAACFAGNTDTDLQRRAVREDTEARLVAKRAALQAQASAVLPEPTPPPPATPPPPPVLVVVTPDGQEIEPRPLDPGGADPLDKLQQILRDAAG